MNCKSWDSKARDSEVPADETIYITVGRLTKCIITITRRDRLQPWELGV